MAQLWVDGAGLHAERPEEQQQQEDVTEAVAAGEQLPQEGPAEGRVAQAMGGNRLQVHAHTSSLCMEMTQFGMLPLTLHLIRSDSLVLRLPARVCCACIFMRCQPLARPHPTGCHCGADLLRGGSGGRWGGRGCR